MKIGLSTYSLAGPITSGSLSVTDALSWMKEHGAEQAEIVPVGFTLTGNPTLVEDIRTKAAELGLELSCYSIGANFLNVSEEEFQKEMERTKGEVRVAAALGCRYIRHDLAAWVAPQNNTVMNFERDLSTLARAARELAEYGQSLGVINLVENHGYYVNGSERLVRLAEMANHPNLRLIIDMGNLLCVDEDPLSGVLKLLPYIGIMHAKDFYVRPGKPVMGQGWFGTTAGRQLRGAIFGNGDINTHEVLAAVKQSGFDGYMSLEFEGQEEHVRGSAYGLENLRRIWEEV